MNRQLELLTARINSTLGIYQDLISASDPSLPSDHEETRGRCCIMGAYMLAVEDVAPAELRPAGIETAHEKIATGAGLFPATCKLDRWVRYHLCNVIERYRVAGRTFVHGSHVTSRNETRIAYARNSARYMDISGLAMSLNDDHQHSDAAKVAALWLVSIIRGQGWTAVDEAALQTIKGAGIVPPEEFNL